MAIHQSQRAGIMHPAACRCIPPIDDPQVIDATGRNVSLDGNATNRVLTILTNVSCAITNRVRSDDQRVA